MNERIKELIESCGIIPEDEHYEVAELIVQECIGVCDRVEDEYLGNEQLPANEKYAIGAGVCVNAIHKHFGVE